MLKETATRFSVIVLSFNRPLRVAALIDSLLELVRIGAELIVVDNNSQTPVREALSPEAMEQVTVIRLDCNIGAAGRNVGIRHSSREFVVVLDDDVGGLTRDALCQLTDLFRDLRLAAVCFHVTDQTTGATINWCHHYPRDLYERRSFPTNEISEGAVAFRRTAIDQTGLYPETFFISHEGPDLAFRLLNRGWLIRYEPSIIVWHAHAEEGRATWRRYYYDTRNVFWLAVRNYPVCYGVRRVIVQVGAMFVYAVRDGFIGSWLRGVVDGIRGLPAAFRQREKPLRETMILMRQIDRNREKLWVLLRERLYRRNVRI